MGMDSLVVGIISFGYTVSGKFAFAAAVTRVSTTVSLSLSHTRAAATISHLLRGLLLLLLEVKPGVIVDKVINFWLDLITPGRGAGESDWCVQGEIE